MDDKLVTLARRLHAKGGSVSWEKTEEEGTYETDFAGFGVQIAEIEEQDEETVYSVRIFDGEGALLDEFTDEDLTEILNRTKATEPSEMFELMQDIHRTARRSAMGVDRAIEAILGALGDA